MLTQAQSRTLDFIVSFFQQHHHAPTALEIASGTGIKSRGVVYRYLLALQEAGYIKLIPSRHRNIELTQKLKRSSQAVIPLLGKIAAGAPLEAIENRDFLDPGCFFTGAELFSLVIDGDSMIDLGIFDGDVVICEKTDVAKTGDIVVAIVDLENATLKRIEFKDSNTIALCPANSRLEPMFYQADRVTIQGQYIGLMRRFISD